MKNEVKVWRQINGHPNIVPFVDAAIQKSSEGRYLNIICEYWREGHLLDLLAAKGDSSYFYAGKEHQL